METTHVPATLEVRETPDNPDVAGIVWGTAVPYDTPIDLGGVREQFAPEAFNAEDVVGTPLCWRHDEPVGVITKAENTPEGLVVEANLANTALGRDAATLVRTGSVQGLSVGFKPVENAWNKTRDTVTRVRAALSELSLTHMPAYPTAAVAAIREETEEMSEATTPDAPEVVQPDNVRELRAELETMRDTVASLQVTERPREPMGEREFYKMYGDAVATRALEDITVDGVEGSDNSPVPTEVSARINLARPTFSAVGATALAPNGMDTNWLLDDLDPTVGDQSAEKTEITSTGANGKIITAPVVTVAGGNDLSLQFIQRASGWDRADYVQRLGEQYARNTNAKVITLLATATKTQALPASVDSASIGEMLGAAATSIANDCGWTANAVVLNPSTFFSIATTAGHGYPYAGGNVGGANLSSLSYTAFGLPFICDPQLGDANPGFIMNTNGVGLRESAGAPFTVEAPVPSLLGVDYAAYGYVAMALLRPESVVKITAANAG